MIKHVKNTIKFRVILLVISAFLLLMPFRADGATLYLEPSEGEFQKGDTFIVEVKIDTEKECINTVEVELKFSPEVLKAIDFSQGSSILTLWPKVPEINQASGLVSFAGGIPGGYCGEIPGDPGPSHLLGRIVLQATQQGEAKLEFLDSSKVLLNDGLGTPAKLKTQGAVFTILSEPFDYTQGKDEWQEELKKDTIPPELFEIEIHQDVLIFEGKYFITFSTTDKQTGLSHFEVKEGDRDWQVAESPYLLEDQSLKSIIKVKAVDKAGNERIAEYIPEVSKKAFFWWIVVVILVGAIAIIAIIWIWKKYIKKH